VLGPVDEGDGDRGPAQRPGGEQPRETAAYDHDPAWAGLVRHDLYLLIRSHAAAAIPTAHAYRARPKYMSSQIALSANSSMSVPARKYCTRHSPLKRR